MESFQDPQWDGRLWCEFGGDGSFPSIEQIQTTDHSQWWNSKPGNPTRHEGAGSCLSCGVAHEQSFRPTSKAVDAGQQIAESLRRWQRSYNVDVDMVKSGARCSEYQERHHGVPLDL